MKSNLLDEVMRKETDKTKLSWNEFIKAKKVKVDKLPTPMEQIQSGIVNIPMFYHTEVKNLVDTHFPETKDVVEDGSSGAREDEKKDIVEEKTETK